MANYKGKINSSSGMKTTSWGKEESTGGEGSQPKDGMFGAEILPRKDVPLNIPNGKYCSVTFLWPSEAGMVEGRCPLNAHGTQLKHLPLGLWQPTGKILN